MITLAFPFAAQADPLPWKGTGTAQFRGTVTAVDSNANKPTKSFTAVDAEGKVMQFRISSLQHLDVRDRVVLSFQRGEKYPLKVVTIKFLTPIPE